MKELNTSLMQVEDFWRKFGFQVIHDEVSGGLVGILPEGVVAFCAHGAAQIEAQTKALQEIGIVSEVSFADQGKAYTFLYSFGDELSIEALRAHFGTATKIRSKDDGITLPTGEDFTPERWVSNYRDLSVFELDADHQALSEEGSSDDLPQQIVGGTLLDRYSLLDADMGDEPATSLPLLGSVVLSGQATVVYAPPNSGKTLLTLYLLGEAVAAARFQPTRCYYVNADDSMEGVHMKHSILGESAIHMLVPGMEGFATDRLAESILSLVETDNCHDVVIIVDTLKKFVDLMDKKQTAYFGEVIRKFVLKGGTFLALAHTRKNEGVDGRLVYGGTSDVIEDFDAACLLVPLGQRSDRNEKLVQFQFKKRRGRNVEETYAYDDDPELTYDVRLASVRLVEEDELASQVVQEQYRSDADLIAAIRREVEAGTVQKMQLVKAVASSANASRSAVMKVLERYTGEDPDNHHWTYSVQARGAKLYRAHPPREPDD